MIAPMAGLQSCASSSITMSAFSRGLESEYSFRYPLCVIFAFGSPGSHIWRHIWRTTSTTWDAETGAPPDTSGGGTCLSDISLSMEFQNACKVDTQAFAHTNRSVTRSSLL